MAIRAIQITRSPMCVRIDLQQLVSGADPTHKLTRCGAPSTSAVGQPLHFHDVRAMSACPPTPEVSLHRSK